MYLVLEEIFVKPLSARNLGQVKSNVACHVLEVGVGEYISRSVGRTEVAAKEYRLCAERVRLVGTSLQRDSPNAVTCILSQDCAYCFLVLVTIGNQDVHFVRSECVALDDVQDIAHVIDEEHCFRRIVGNTVDCNTVKYTIPFEVVDNARDGIGSGLHRLIFPIRGLDHRLIPPQFNVGQLIEHFHSVKILFHDGSR